jgi:cellulose synthase/poly-beta-1,6-N-acetylglucosamine synthase-like glycosyltransferase
MAVRSSTARIAIIITSGFSILAISGATGEAVLPHFSRALQDGEIKTVAELIALYGIFFMLACSVLVHHIANLGYHRRQRVIDIEPAHGTPSCREPDREPLLILVPSYREEPDVVRRTLWSAGLVEYPDRRVLLLIDDPPHPASAADAVLLDAARQLPTTLGEAFGVPAGRMHAALAEYRAREDAGAVQVEAEAKRLAALYEWAAAWLDAEADAYVHSRGQTLSHTDRLFVQRILNEPAYAWRAHADDLRASKIGAVAIGLEYQRLAALFRVEFESFERKRYANLSHAPNKAMNLNSYIALIGGSFREVARADGCWLERCDPAAATLHAPSSRYIVTFDADSLIKVFIEDRILIEDAAATVDLLKEGWSVYHHPGRLAYSATPADFGALLIQRRRWANGGLLILPNLLGYLFRRPWSLRRFGKGLLRAPNLMSSAISGIGLPILLLYPFDEQLVPPWMALAAIPYFLLLGLNLSLAGYKWADLPRVYALNVLLIPVNLAGTLQSLYQALNGRPIPFKRTPKLPERTRVPAVYITLIYGLCIYALVACVVDTLAGRYTHSVFTLLNAAAGGYGIAAYIGFAASRDDMLAQLRRRRLSFSFRMPIRRSLVDARSSVPLRP